MITCIKQSTAFHDMIELRWISSKKAKKIITKLSIKAVWKELDQLFSCLNEAVELGTGVLYVLMTQKTIVKIV